MLTIVVLPGFYEVERERQKRPSLVSTGRYAIFHKQLFE